MPGVKNDPRTRTGWAGSIHAIPFIHVHSSSLRSFVPSSSVVAFLPLRLPPLPFYVSGAGEALAVCLELNIYIKNYDPLE